MASSGRIYHSSQSQLWAALDRSCSSCGYVGEVVGIGTSIEAVHAGFMRSAPHRAAILNGRYRLIGSGVAHVGRYYYVTEIFGG